MKITINHGFLEVCQGDIVEQDTEAIVNAANNHLWMGGGVAGAIKRNGGDGIEREAMTLGPIDVGQAVMTSSGLLKAKHVIHAVVMGQDLHTRAEYIQAATGSTLALAEKSRITSISLPALGTGVGGFSIFHCAKIMLTEAVSFLTLSINLKHIRFVLFDKETFDAFEQELKLQFSSKRR